MKKVILLSFFIFNFFLVQAQKEIVTNWYSDILNTYKADKNKHRSCVPYEIIELNDKEIILGTYDFNAWTVRRIEKKTGQTIWINAKTPDYPDNSQRRYYMDNMFLGDNNTLEVYGVKSATDNTIGNGDPVRVTYDITTGEEQATYFPKQNTPNSPATILKPSNLSSIFRRDDKKGFYTLNFKQSPDSYTLVALDSNLILRDTICAINYLDDIDKDEAKAYKSYRPTKIKEHIYLPVGVWKGLWDTSSLQTILYKIDTKGNIKMRKKIGVPLYNLLYYSDIRPISDGFLAFGMVDTSYNLFTIPQKATNTTMVAKIDTNGIVLWKSFLKTPNNKPLESIRACEDKKRGGFWAFLTIPANDSIYLYYIDKKGKSLLLANIKFSDNIERVLPSYDSWCLNDGSIFTSFIYQKAINDLSYPKAQGISFIEAEELDKALMVATRDSKHELSVNIYPNPTHDVLNINVLDYEKSLTIECYDMLGRLSYQDNFQSFIQINTATWSRDFYLYVIKNQDNKILKTGKVILN